MKISKAYYSSPIGLIEIAGTDEGISSLSFVRRPAEIEGPAPDVLRLVIRELDEYFRGTRREFSARLSLGGTDFQKKAWAELRKIPFGRTATYGEIAEALGKPGAARAVGRANHLNPVSIIIPCHRVIGHDSGLVGYEGGLWRKRWLLAHEESSARNERDELRSSRGKNPQGG